MSKNEECRKLVIGRHKKSMDIGYTLDFLTSKTTLQRSAYSVHNNAATLPHREGGTALKTLVIAPRKGMTFSNVPDIPNDNIAETQAFGLQRSNHSPF